MTSLENKDAVESDDYDEYDSFLLISREVHHNTDKLSYCKPHIVMVTEMQMQMPSPQCVGLEFVRQYYTLLHEVPEHLHRFYSHNSSFVHGGVEKPGEEQPPVKGQMEIHKKIMSLNFRDCRAKIRQVDSQATVGDAVVVQVTGELSNNGQPMRRFMQTFVLAPQSPKKYYVHNDIFRYQDEVFHDGDTDTDIQEETLDSEQDNVETSSQPEAVQDPTVTSFFETGSAQPTISNGNVHIERAESPATKSVEEDEAPKEEEIEPTLDASFEEKEESEKDVEPEIINPEPSDECQKPGPVSWAALASMNTSPSAPPPTTNMQQPPTRPLPVKPAEPKPEPINTAPQPQRIPRPPRDRDLNRPNEGDEFGRRSRFPDNQQLFVGNLPHNTAEKELKQYFETYGNVLEVRINRKSTTRDVPNFGFVVFEEPDTVQRVLAARTVMLRGDHRLNVEEKKQRSEQGGRPGSGTRVGGRGGLMGGGMGRGGMGIGNSGRGGPRGGSSANRGDRLGSGGGGGRGGFGPRR